MLIVELRSGEHLLTGMYASRRRGLPKEMPAEHKFKYENVIKIKNNPYLVIFRTYSIIHLIKPSSGLFF
jgi:hypothetical protein